MSSQSADFSAVVIQTTIGDRDAAGRLAERLVESQLAACVQVIGPIASTYRWQGAVEKGEEFLLQIKTSVDRMQQAVDAVKRWHDYDEPELIVLPVVGGSTGYLDWVVASTRGASSQTENEA